MPERESSGLDAQGWQLPLSSANVTLLTLEPRLSSRVELTLVLYTRTHAALPFVYQFTAGAIAGVTELLCLYPLGQSSPYPPTRRGIS